MDEMQLNEILSSYRDAINALIERIDAQDDMVKAVMEKVESLDKLIFDEVLNPAKEAMDQYNYEVGLNEFGDKYGDKFEGYNDKLRPIEGEDFDIVKEAYDGYNAYEPEEGEEKPDTDLYVDELIKQVDEQLDSIREAIGAPEDAEVAIVSDEEGEAHVEVDGQEIDPEAGAEEAPAEDVDVNDLSKDVEITEGEGASDPEELAALEKELEQYR